MSDSLQAHGHQPTRLLCPWDFPGKTTGVSCHALLQGIFLTQGSNLAPLICLLSWQADSFATVPTGSPSTQGHKRIRYDLVIKQQQIHIYGLQIYFQLSLCLCSFKCYPQHSGPHSDLPSRPHPLPASRSPPPGELPRFFGPAVPIPSPQEAFPAPYSLGPLAICCHSTLQFWMTLILIALLIMPCLSSPYGLLPLQKWKLCLICAPW